jgi:uncharacterized protein (DUF1499 family)
MVNLAGLVALACLAGGPALAWLRVVPALTGFAVFALGGVLALVVATVAIVRAARGRGLPPGGIAAIVGAAVFMVLASRGAGVPRINDFTTDPDDPPPLVHAATLPANRGRDLTYPPAFAAEQRQCCTDLRPARLRRDPGHAFADARRLAEHMPGWTVTHTDEASGTIEAIAETPLFHFQDDVAIRIRPDGADGARVDIRSKSRDGQGDIGANAARIRAYVTALEGATTTQPRTE